jgi:hypothetical protein
MHGNSEGFMTEQASALSRHDLEAKIVKRCWEDEAFRRQFTSDPAGTFVKYLEVPAAHLPKISVHQEEPGSWHIVLQAKPARANELSEEDLEKVAGGASASPIVTVTLIGTAAVASVAVASITIPQKGW